MPLPKVSTPIFELNLVSSNKKVKYRPFLVKEEKALLMAMETNEEKRFKSENREKAKKMEEKSKSEASEKGQQKTQMITKPPYINDSCWIFTGRLFSL